MQLQGLFQEALGLRPPWKVTFLEFSSKESRLDITIDFPRGSAFPCPECGVQGAKARARGYRTSKNILAMSYLIAGKLDFGLPT